jgi:hypothetical protein
LTYDNSLHHSSHVDLAIQKWHNMLEELRVILQQLLGVEEGGISGWLIFDKKQSSVESSYQQKRPNHKVCMPMANGTEHSYLLQL